MTRGSWILGLGCLLLCFGGCAGKSASDPAENGVRGTDQSKRSAQPIPYLSDGCGQYGLKFDPKIASTECPGLCDCDVVIPLYGTPRGCPVAGDCDALCRDADSVQLYACLYGSCVVDSDCYAPQTCLVGPGREQGICGTPGTECADDHDCAADTVCVAFDNQGTRRCVAPDRESPCNEDRHCAGAHCALPPDQVVGVCSRGQLNDRCFVPGECEAPLFCGGTSCSDGSYGTSCDTDAQCRRGYCSEGTCQDGRDNDYCDKAAECASGICVFNIRCASGEVDATCESDADCHSGLCARIPGVGDSACTTGEPGSKCGDAADCQSGDCSSDRPYPRDDDFGRCR
jgi:hypothetical protein